MIRLTSAILICLLSTGCFLRNQSPTYLSVVEEKDRRGKEREVVTVDLEYWKNEMTHTERLDSYAYVQSLIRALDISEPYYKKRMNDLIKGFAGYRPRLIAFFELLDKEVEKSLKLSKTEGRVTLRNAAKVLSPEEGEL